MKRVLVFALSLLLVACSGGNETNKVGAKETKSVNSSQVGQAQANIFQSIDASQSVALMKNKKNLLILDVRSPPELKEGKIKDSILVPFWDIAKGRYQVPTDKPILLVCAVGGRSYAIGQMLHKKGYPEVYNLSGGISGWKKSGMSVVY